MIDENGKVTSYEYDNSNWLTKVVYPNADVVTYAYNNAGDRVSEQLNEKPSVVYEYDAAGRLLSKGSETFSYDADGNMVTDAVATYTWNSDNRLTRVEKTIGGCKHDKFRKGHGFGHLKHGKETVVYEEYAYLPQDWRRITRKTGKYQINRRGDSRIAPKEQTFVSIYDGDDESHEYLLRKSKFKFRSKRHSRRESLKLFREFVGGPDSDDIKHTRYNRLSLAMLKDGLGSTIALTGINGRPIARINYDAWGEFRWPEKGKCRINDCDKFLKRFSKTRGLGRLRHNAHAFGKRFAYKLSPYLYTGRRYSTFTNQYFNRNRYYSPALGRFTSKDPIGFNGGINLYRYADNNPVRWVDPMGLKEILVWLEHSNYTYKYDISTAGGLREGREYWKQSSNLSEFERNHIVGSRTLKDELGAWKEYKINIPKGQLYWVLKEFEIDNWFANIFEETECKREFKRKEIIPRFLTEISLVRDSNPYPTKEYTTKGIFSPRENPINSFPKTFPNPIDGKRNYIYSQPIELPVEYEVAK
jgi:RHS repeat-associated protein